MIESSKVGKSSKPIEFDVKFGAYSSRETSPFRKIIYDEVERCDRELNKRQTYDYDTVTSRIEGGALSLLERNAFETLVINAEIKKKDTTSVIKKINFRNIKRTNCYQILAEITLTWIRRLM